VNPNVEPLAKHPARSPLRPLRRIGGPTEEPILEEEIEMLDDERFDFVDRVEIGTEEDRQVIVRFRDLKAWPVIIERVRPIGVRLLRDDQDR
jgi:hypothetical protein